MKIVIKDTTETKRAIMQCGMSMAEFAERVDIGKYYWSAILNGNRHPSPALAKRIADALGKEIKDVFRFE